MANFDTPAVNPGKNFLTTKVTSPFLKQHKSEEVAAIADNLYKIVEGTLRIVTNPGPQGPQIDDDLMDSDIVGKLGEFASNTAQSMLDSIESAKQIASSFTGKIASDVASIPGDILSMATKKAVSDITDMIKEAIEKQTIPNEIRNELLDKLLQQESFTNAINDINEKAAKVSKLMNDMKEIEDTRTSLVLKYIEQGPKFIQDQLNKQTNNATTAFENGLTAHYNDLKSNIDSWKEKMSDVIASKITTAAKKKIFDEQKDNFDKMRKAALVIKNNAHKVLQVAKLKIMAMLGINLPIT